MPIIIEHQTASTLLGAAQQAGYAQGVAERKQREQQINQQAFLSAMNIAAQSAESARRRLYDSEQSDKERTYRSGEIEKDRAFRADQANIERSDRKARSEAEIKSRENIKAMDYLSDIDKQANDRLKLADQRTRDEQALALKADDLAVRRQAAKDKAETDRYNAETRRKEAEDRAKRQRVIDQQKQEADAKVSQNKQILGKAILGKYNATDLTQLPLEGLAAIAHVDKLGYLPDSYVRDMEDEVGGRMTKDRKLTASERQASDLVKLSPKLALQVARATTETQDASGAAFNAPTESARMVMLAFDRARYDPNVGYHELVNMAEEMARNNAPPELLQPIQKRVEELTIERRQTVLPKMNQELVSLVTRDAVASSPEKFFSTDWQKEYAKVGEQLGKKYGVTAQEFESYLKTVRAQMAAAKMGSNQGQ